MQFIGLKRRRTDSCAHRPGTWAKIHGEPFELVLDGPAGGKFTQGVDAERVQIDTLDFIRTLSGRLPGTGVLSHPLPL